MNWKFVAIAFVITLGAIAIGILLSVMATAPSTVT